MSRWMIAIAVVACVAGPLRPASGQFDRTDSQKEIELGRQAAREVEKEFALSRNTAYQERVRRIGSALVDALPYKAYPYEFKVLADPEFNAFCLPGGFMYVNEGLLTKLPSDDAVAFVMGHELTHAAHRHWHRMMEKMKGITILAIAAEIATGSDLAGFVNSLIALHYSREDEADADRAGMETAWAAGYDPQGAIEATQIMVKMERSSIIPVYLKDHPPARDRLRHLQEEAEELKTRTRPTPRPSGPADTSDLAALAGMLPHVACAPNPWFPLATGDQWTYRAEGGEGKATYTIRVAGALPCGSAVVYRAETSLGTGAAVLCQLMTSSGEVCRRNRPASRQSPWQTEFVTEIGAGRPVQRGSCTFTLLETEPVTVPCGSFTDVRKIRMQKGTNHYDLWFGRGVGLLKRVCIETGVTETLTAYRVDKR